MFIYIWFPFSILAVNHHNEKNWVLSFLTHNLRLILMRMKQKEKFFFEKKKIKMADSKKVHFSKSPILKIFLWKFLGFVLGLVGLIVMQRALLHLNLYGCEAVRHKRKNSLKTQKKQNRTSDISEIFAIFLFFFIVKI